MFSGGDGWSLQLTSLGKAYLKRPEPPLCRILRLLKLDEGSLYTTLVTFMEHQCV